MSLRSTTLPLMNSIIPAAARLVLHLTEANELTEPEYQRYHQILTLFMEALDDFSKKGVPPVRRTTYSP